MADVVVVSGDDTSNSSVTTEDVETIVEERAEQISEESAERDVELSRMIGEAVSPLYERISALESLVTPDDPEAIQDAAETAAAETAEEIVMANADHVENVADDAAEETAEEIVTDGTTDDVIEETVADAPEGTVNEAGDVIESDGTETVPVVDDNPEKPAKRKSRDKTPRQKRNWTTTLLGGSGGVRRGGNKK